MIHFAGPPEDRGPCPSADGDRASEDIATVDCRRCLFAVAKFGLPRGEALGSGALHRLFDLQAGEVERLRAEVGRLGSALTQRGMDPRPLPKVDEATQQWLEISSSWRWEDEPPLAQPPRSSRTFIAIARLLKNIIDRLEGRS